jgi:predicted Zn-dependent peptidase
LAAAAALLFFLSPAVADDPNIAFERYKLENGMEVILHPDNSVPLVAVNVWYHVGSGDESHGKSGFAHLFEHMLFQGSKNVGEDKHFAILKEIGATGVNGTTNFDRTNYFEVVPSHQVEVGLWLESDRMGYLLPLVTKKSLDNQIEVVRNERRQRVDNVPYGETQMKMFEMLYPEGHPYRYVVIGKHEDLAGAKLEDVKSFYSKWYAPANATLVLAGDFDVAEAKKLVEKWFGSFPASTKPERRPPETPVLSATSRIEITDDLAKLRRVDYLWHTPAFYAPGDAELDIAGDALARTGTGRLYKILVHEKQLAQSVAAYQSSREYSSHFGISVTLRSGADQAEVEKIVEAELERLRREPVTQRELDRAVVNFESGVVWSLESLNARADLLQRYNHYLGDPNGITRDLDRYRDSSPEAVQKTIARYLGKDNRVEIVTVPGEAKGK